MYGLEKLNLAPEEKFDIYLLLLRSINDKTLIGPAYEAARNISDETTRAQALLDVVKEIDNKTFRSLNPRVEPITMANVEKYKVKKEEKQEEKINVSYEIRAFMQISYV